MINRNDILETSNILSDVLKNRSQGDRDLFEQIKHLFMYKGIVTGIDEVGKIFDELSPPRTIKVKVFYPYKLSGEKILYPLNDFDKNPISIGEAVLFYFADESLSTGYWLNRIPVGKGDVVKAVDYYTQQKSRNDSAVEAFGDKPKVNENVTEEVMLSETKKYDTVPVPENDLSGDKRVIGRKDEFVLKSDGSFEVGFGASEHAILGDKLQSMLFNTTDGKFYITYKSLSTLLPITLLIIQVLELVATMAVVVNPSSATLMAPIIKELKTRQKELTAYVPLLNTVTTDHISTVVKLK